MKICFECIGFTTNPLFILDTEDKEARPIPYGTIVDNPGPDGREIEFWPENHDPSLVSEPEIRAEYKRLYAERGVCLNDVSKEAWLEERFGETLHSPSLGIDKRKKS